MLKTRSAAPAHQRTIVLEITQSEALLVVLDRERNQRPLLRWRRRRWLQEAASLHAPGGAEELTAALAELVAQERLHGSNVLLTLGGDFCVTRVVAGPSDKVRHELRSLEERSAFYLSLGAGAKVCMSSQRSIDAKRSQAWLAVTNERTLGLIAQAVQQAGLKPVRIEHSLVSLCRAVGHAGCDADRPVLIIETNHRGVDLGVSYQGRLLLDYRPGGLAAKEQVAATVSRHLSRIQRHCARHFQFASGKLERVILCGEPEEIRRVREQFEQLGTLSAEVLQLSRLAPEWTIAGDDDAEARVTSAIGGLLGGIAAEAPAETPDLMEHLRRTQRLPLWPTLARTAWPIAAAAAVWLLILAAGQWRHWQCARLEAQASAIEEVEGELATIKLRLGACDARLKALALIGDRLEDPAWHELLASIGGSLPQGVWLDSLVCDRSGAVSLTGPSYTEDGIYEFLRNLKNVPLLANVALEGTRNTRLATGPATMFDVKSELNAASGRRPGS